MDNNKLNTKKLINRKNKKNENTNNYNEKNQNNNIGINVLINDKAKNNEVETKENNMNTDNKKEIIEKEKTEQKKEQENIINVKSNEVVSINKVGEEKKQQKETEKKDTKKKKKTKKENEKKEIVEKEKTEQKKEQENIISVKNSEVVLINNKEEKKQQMDIVMPKIKPIPFVDLSKVISKQQKIEKKEIDTIPLNQKKLLTQLEHKDAFYKNFYREIEKFILNEMLLESGSKVLICVSGGVDSVALLDVMANLANKYSFSIYVAHYNHKLRGISSDEDEKFVRELSASYNIPYYWQNGKVQQYAEKNSVSIEEAARFLRYFFFERIARQINADFLVTAHTADDSAETFLLNLFRGAGLTGLSGIPARRQFIKNVILCRPFISFKKQKIIEYATKRKLKWREDESNLLDKYTRNKIRNDLIPKLKKDYTPAIVDIINRASKLINSVDRIIHDYVRTHISTVLVDISSDRVSIKLSLFKTFDEFIRGEILQVILSKYFRLLPQSMNIIDRILKLSNSNTGAICEISKNIFAIRDRQVITIARKITITKINQNIDKIGTVSIGNLTFILKEVHLSEIEYIKNPNIEYFDFDKISSMLTIRTLEPGDEFIPLGMSNKIKVNDFLSNEKVSILEKPNTLIIQNLNNEIIWVCKKRISDKFKVDKHTKRVLKIEIRES